MPNESRLSIPNPAFSRLPLILCPSTDCAPVAILFGGAGAEHEISCRSACRVLSVLSSEGVPLLPVYIDRSGAFRFFLAEGLDGERLFRLLSEGPDALPSIPNLPTFPVKLGGRRGFLLGNSLLSVLCAFPVLHGDHGEDGEIQGLLAAAEIPFVGCGVTAGAVTADKALTKRVALSLGIRTAPFLETEEQDPEVARRAAEASLSYPLFVKPARLGSSVGASPVPEPSAFSSSYLTARVFGKVLIEEAVDIASELEVAFLDADGAKFSSPGAVLSNGVFYSYREKYGQGSVTATDPSPALDPAVEKAAIAASARLAEVLGLRDLSRIDFFLTKQGELLFNEINTLPGLTETSLYPALAAQFTHTEAALYRRLIALAADRRSR